MLTTVRIFLLALFNSRIKALIVKYGKQIVVQLLKAGYEWVKEKNKHPEWTEEIRHKKLAEHLRSLDLVPETELDEEAIDLLCRFFLD